ncbi:hypothetical protein Pcinc_019433 [Petrolisthes cinctipes]|uniref:Uncharacterized protein n=1 Tax=Petrolisthes cinctipes TaxID=88211 RepID=A0AAE1FK47_PETCI|nr:hypothetical protein Pcinc_019433 [Petrolisthes cinctipes]
MCKLCVPGSGPTAELQCMTGGTLLVVSMHQWHIHTSPPPITQISHCTHDYYFNLFDRLMVMKRKHKGNMKEFN